MTSNLDSPDFTSLATRAMLSLPQSPLVSSVAGYQSIDCDVALWARSLNLLVAGNSNVITLSVTGVSTGFVYLNAMPAYDGGIYYIPAMPVIDAQVTIRWYQVTTATVSIYVIASDEPISVSLFNPVTPTQAVSERLLYGMPTACPANLTTNVHVTLDSTTNALRCAVDNPANIVWAKVIGDQSSTVYFDGAPTSVSFPVTPIPVNRNVDTSVLVAVLTQPALTANLYVAVVNTPDFAGSIPLIHSMASNELAPDPKQSEVPNQLAAIVDGTIAASGTVTLVAAGAGLQLRVIAISIMQYTAVATAFDLEDTSNNKFFHYHYSATSNWILVPLFGQLAARGAGLRLHNTTAIISGAVGVTLWYSVL